MTWTTVPELGTIVGMPDVLINDIVAGRYRVEGVVGEGGMGRVFVARHLALGERVALKLLRRDRELLPDARERLKREARAVARMRGENIARVMDAGISDAGPFIVMEYVSGRTMTEVLDEEGPLSVERAVEVALHVCVALAEAHGLGIVHRDLKPSNLRLTTRADGSALVKVLDFGIAKVDHLAAQSLTETASVLGSPKYMSPEQVREARNVDARTDIWSLGVVLYELLTGRLPFEAYTVSGVLASITADEPISARTYRPDLDEDLERVLARMLAKRPEDRPATVVEVARMLAAFGGAEAPALVERATATAAASRGWTEPPLDVAPEAPAARERSVATIVATTSEPISRHAARPRSLKVVYALGAGAIAATAFVAIIRTTHDTADARSAPAAASAEPTAVATPSPELPASPQESGPPFAEPILSSAPVTAASIASAPPARSGGARTSREPPRAPPKPPSSTFADFDFGPRK